MGFVIEEELKKLPSSPGVYLMHDRRDEIIYVGKAVSLKNRVRQYFQTSYKKSPKIEQMVGRIAWFEYIVTDSELEALVLENNLIKENRPRYNTMLRDDKTYPYIKVTVNEEFPRILLTRRMKKDKARYYGPFSSAGAVRDTIDLLQKTCRVRACERKLPEKIGEGRPCLNYHIHMCGAPCMGYIGREEYAACVEKALDYLDGNFDPVIRRLQEEMREASERMDYESAARSRDLLASVTHVAQRQKISSADGQDRDVIALAMDNDDAVIQVFLVREGKMIGREHHYIRVALDDTPESILESFVKQFYADTPMLPREIWLQCELPDAELIRAWLSGKRHGAVHLVVPKKGSRERLVELAHKNAEILLEQDREKLRREQARSAGAVRELEELIGITGVKRMEAYDISNTSGVESVGSMVVYEDGKPRRHDYRKFRIRTVQGPDDYASMREVLTRRFTHEDREDRSFGTLPDLLLMDGGKGQVNVALEVLRELDLGKDIRVCGMVKDDRHNTRGLYYNGQELPIDRRSEAFRLITRVQDEAHRFAVEYHRSLRGKDQVRSVLDDIPGIGPVRRRALMKEMKDIESIRNADPERLAEVEGMDRRSARAVYEFFHKDTAAGKEGPPSQAGPGMRPAGGAGEPL